MTAGVIRPGTVFRDQHGDVAQLHGVGIQRFGDTFWAWGEDKARGQLFTGVSCYRSTDLATWELVGHALAVDETIPDLGSDRVVERPKVMREPRSGTYVMFLHIDSQDYADARLGYAVSPSPEGPYTYVRSERPLGRLSRDIGVFQDDDGTGYVLSEDRDHGLHIYRLADDYLGVSEFVSTTLTPDGVHGYESPALVKVDGVYHLIGSDLTGWATNDNKYATARDLAGPWSPWRDIAPAGAATFDSQTSTVVTVSGSETTSYVYVGDRWRKDDLAGSPAVWLPLTVGHGRVTLTWRDEWSLDTTTGVIA